MVLETRFPELFDGEKKKKKDADGNYIADDSLDVSQSMKDQNLNTFDMDRTRTKLSNLFHCVSEVCSAEFELIAHVFSSEGARTSYNVFSKAA
jgi:hypothetical protein